MKTNSKKKHFPERREFIRRMLGQVPSGEYSKCMWVATQVFEGFDGELDFLSRVKKPSFITSQNFAWFLGEEGKEYLYRRFMEYCWDVDGGETFEKHEKRYGEDVSKEKKTFAEFMNQ